PARLASASMGFTTGPACDLAVCVPAESHLLLQGIGDTVRESCGVGAVEEVVMTRLEGGPYKDAVRFSNGVEILLQRLDPGPAAGGGGAPEGRAGGGSKWLPRPRSSRRLRLSTARRGGEALLREQESVARGVDADHDVLVVPVAGRHRQVLEADLQLLSARLDAGQDL